MNNNEKINAIVIGLGKIGLEYDYNLSPKEYNFSHCQSIDSHPKFNLIGGFDKNQNQLKKFKKKYPNLVTKFSDLNKVKIDLVVLSVETQEHENALLEILKILRPKIILLEKPVGKNLNQTKNIIKKIIDNKIFLTVNYIRMYEKGHRELSNYLNNEILEYPLKINVKYSNGLMNNCSHYINYLSSFMGEIKKIEVKNKNLNSAEPNFSIKYKNGISFFESTSNSKYPSNSIEIKGIDGGVNFFNYNYSKKKIVCDVIGDFSENISISNKSTNIEIELNMKKYQKFVYDNIYNFLINKEQLLCNEESAINTMEVIDKINNYYLKKTL